MPRAAALALTLLLTLAAGCDRGRDLVTLEVAPSSGPPGTLLTITGLDAGAHETATLELFVGGQPAPFVVRGSTIVAAVPLFLGDDAWPAPPSGGQRIELRSGATVVGRAGTTVAVAPLPEAPGSTAAVVEAMADAAGSLESLLALLPPVATDEADARAAVFGMLHELLAEAERTIGDAAGPGAERERELLDAILASTGALEYARALAAALAEARSRAVGPTQHWASTLPDLLHVQAGAGLCRGDGEDFELACRMQVQVVLADFTEAFVRPTASTYANSVGLAAGLTAIVATGGAALPFAAIVGAILGVADFVMGKVVPALLPSRISEFSLSIEETTIEYGARTESIVTVTTSNDPPPISLLDVIDQVYTLMGLNRATAPKLAAQLDEVMRNTARFVLDQYARVLRALDASAPGVFAGVSSDDLSLPYLTWGPVEVRSDDLIALFSFDEAVVAPRESDLEWEGVALGEATVRVMPRGPGERSKVLLDGGLCSGCAYSGAAFGLDAPSATELVVVGRLELRADPPQGMAPLATTLRWDGIPTDAAERFACTLDPGDGSEPYAIDDCAATTEQAHRYPYASGVRTPTGRYEATLAVTGTARAASVPVLANWSLTATPTSGDEPLDVAFAWRGFDPGEPLSCRFDPGDGAPARAIDDCLAGSATEHRYESRGGYSPTLIVTGPARQDLKDVAVDVSEENPVCALARTADAWQATVSMSYEGQRSQSGGSTSVERSGDVTLTLGDRGQSEHVVWWRVLEASGTASVHDVASRSTRTEHISGTSGTPRVSGGLSLRLSDCSVTRIHVTIHIDARNDTVGGREAPATVGLFEVHDVPLSGTATVPAYVMSGAEMREDHFRLAFGANFTEGFGSGLAERWDSQVGTAVVSWAFTPVAGAGP